MYQLRHHNFFKVFLPKNRDPENMSAMEMLMEETTLHYGDQIKTNYKIDIEGKTILDIELLPSHIYVSWYFNRKKPDAQFRAINDIIDKLFSQKLLNFNPIYRCTGLLDYHFHFFQGEKTLFFSHLKHQIIPICKRKFDNKEKEIIPENSHISFEDFEKIILEWIEINSKEIKKNNLLLKLKSLNWLQILGLIITTIGVLTSLIVDWDIILNFISKYLNF